MRKNNDEKTKKDGKSPKDKRSDEKRINENLENKRTRLVWD